MTWQWVAVIGILLLFIIAFTVANSIFTVIKYNSIKNTQDENTND